MSLSLDLPFGVECVDESVLFLDDVCGGFRSVSPSSADIDVNSTTGEYRLCWCVAMS